VIYQNSSNSKTNIDRRLTKHSPDELREHASSTGFKDRVIHANRGPSYGTGLSGAGLVDFDVSWSARDETILTASAGTRVELKEYDP
jgi:hypothetical protein